MEAAARSVLQSLLTTLDLPLEAIDSSIRLIGCDPVVPSRYRVGLASACALAAQAVGIIEIWRPRGGRDQTVTIDLRRAAVPGLRWRSGLIYVSVSCYGYDGPRATGAGYDQLGPMASGLATGKGSGDAPLMALHLHAQRLSRRLSCGGRRQQCVAQAGARERQLPHEGLTDRRFGFSADTQAIAAAVLAGWGRRRPASPRSGAGGSRHDRHPLRRHRAPAADTVIFSDAIVLGHSPGTPGRIGARLAHAAGASRGPTQQ